MGIKKSQKKRHSASVPSRKSTRPSKAKKGDLRELVKKLGLGKSVLEGK